MIIKYNRSFVMTLHYKEFDVNINPESITPYPMSKTKKRLITLIY